MKKTYAKPNIAFKKLAMSSNLSSGCQIEQTFAEFSCPVLIPEWGETVFTQSNCDWSNDDYSICYHVPTASGNVFGS